jgi:hypothetical protein
VLTTKRMIAHLQNEDYSLLKMKYKDTRNT